MAKLLLRDNDICLNCAERVPERYCTHCGQENVEQRKSFVHLVTHFVEDLVHYDGAFWKTVKYLLFRPARLTREYLSGRRKAFVPPVKLYIFINFLTFFLIAVLPSKSHEKIKINATARNSEYYNPDRQKENFVGDYASVRELDSVQALLPPSERHSFFVYTFERKLAQVNETTTSDERAEKIVPALINNLPKVLFIYMPIFAFALWLFHGKKRWFYFDHAIFTLHYFSFMLLTFSFYLVIRSMASFINGDVAFAADTILLGIMFWWICYFFVSHRQMYGETSVISTSKGVVLFIINIVIMCLLLITSLIYFALNINSIH